MLNKAKGLEDFESDEVFNQFLTDKFDVKHITTEAVQKGVVAEYLVKLSSGVSLLDKALHHQVSEHYEDLLSQATEIETFEGVLLVVHQQIRMLLNSAEKLRSRVLHPYETIESLTRKLQRLHVVCDLLRKIVRIVRLCRRLRGHMEKEPKEVSKALNCLNELEDIEDMAGIKVIEAEIDYINKTKLLITQQNTFKH